MTRGRGFTLVDLMVVVAILTIAGGIALISMGRTNRNADLDGFTSDVRNTMTEARRRAVSTRNVFLVTVNENSVQWCQASTSPEAINWGTLPATCPLVAPAGMEMGGLHYAGGWQAGGTAPKVAAVAWARDVDKGQGGVAWLTMPATVYFLPDGTIDSDQTTPPPSLEGFTLRLQTGLPSGTPGDLLAGRTTQRKIYVYPFGGRPRATDRW